jgi:hypothetical protein
LHRRGPDRTSPALIGALVSLPGSADYGRKKEESITDNGLITSQSFKRNYFYYREIGGKTTVKGDKEGTQMAVCLSVQAPRQ